MKCNYIGLWLACAALAAKAQTPTALWNHAYGGSSIDRGLAICRSGDGGFAIAGRTYSSDGDMAGGHGLTDGWVIKVNSAGTVEWRRVIGGSVDDEFNAIAHTSDGGYILVGSTASTDGDINQAVSGFDQWVVKLDASGATEWQSLLGTGANDFGYTVAQTIDGGYIVGGSMASPEGTDWGTAGTLIKLNSAGSEMWLSGGDGIGEECITSVAQTADGGFIAAGYSSSPSVPDGDPNETNNGLYDVWVIRVNDQGQVEENNPLHWQRFLGGSLEDRAYSIHQGTDGGFILVAEAHSSNGDVIGNHDTGSIGSSDAWVVHLSSTGTIDWQRALGGSFNERANDVELTSDGGYVLACRSESFDGDVGLGSAMGTGWIVKLTTSGALEWHVPINCTGFDEAMGITQLNDGNYLTVGAIGAISVSVGPSGNTTTLAVAGYHAMDDAFVLKLGDATGQGISQLLPEQLHVFPNPGTDSFILEGLQGIRSVEVSDALGQVVHVTPVRSVSRIELMLPHLAPGYYHLRALGDERAVVTTLVVQ